MLPLLMWVISMVESYRLGTYSIYGTKEEVDCIRDLLEIYRRNGYYPSKRKDKEIIKKLKDMCTELRKMEEKKDEEKKS